MQEFKKIHSALEFKTMPGMPRRLRLLGRAVSWLRR